MIRSPHELHTHHSSTPPLPGADPLPPVASAPAMASRRALPEGWRIEGYWTGIGTPSAEYHKTGSRTTDAEIASADRITVSYTSRRTGVTDYRSIGGAMNRAAVGNIIRYTTRVVSPVPRGHNR